MRTIPFAVVLCASSALAQTQAPVFRVQFVPPAELAGKPNRPTTSADGAYALNAVVSGTNATTKQPWTVTIPVRSYALHPASSASGHTSGKRQFKPVRFSFHKSAFTTAFGEAVAREDRIVSVKLDFRPLNNGLRATSVVVHDLDHASLEFVDEYVEATFPTYQKITWTWVDGQKTQTDEWIKPKE